MNQESNHSGNAGNTSQLENIIVQHMPDVSWGILLHSHGLSLFDTNHLLNVVEKYQPFRYPDKTLEFSFPCQRSVELFYKELHVSMLLHRNIGFRNLLGFPLKRYELLFSKDYDDRTGDRGLGLGPGLLFRPGENDLGHLQFSIRFHTRLSQRSKIQLANRLSAWFKGVANEGLDSEGPIRPVQPSFELRGKWMSLRVDARLSGPRTLIWLLMEAFNFGHEVAVINAALYNQDDESSIQESLLAARRVCALGGGSWTDADAQRLIEESHGGIDAETVRIPLLI